MNEADDSYHKYGWQYQLTCGHKTKSQEIEMHGQLTQIAFPILTIGEQKICEQCNGFKMQKIKRLTIFEVEDSPEIV